MRHPTSIAHRFRVVVHSVGGARTEYSVVTHFGVPKASALATLAHRASHDRDGDFYDLDVVDLGPVGMRSNGFAELRADDLVSRSEW